MWDHNDQQGFVECTQQQIGQINLLSSLGQYLYHLTVKTTKGNILEVGAWNGLGSTRVIANALSDSTSFYALENNIDKVNEAKQHYQGRANIHITASSVLPYSDHLLYQIQQRFPHAQSQWLMVDLENTRQVPSLDTILDPSISFEWIFLDGGEYTTYFEFEVLKSRTRKFILDDINTDKCKLIIEEVQQGSKHPGWTISQIHTQDRNGWAVLEKNN
jgi:hypothetical protein